MQAWKLYLPPLLAILTLIGIACGGEQIDVSITVVPEAPTVINADLTIEEDQDSDGIPDKTTEIGKPWFAITFVVQNNHSEAITVVTYTLDVSGFKNGTEQKKTVEIDPGEINATYLHADISPGDPPSSSGTWFIHSLPELDEGVFNYTVEVKPQGWVGTTTSPNNRLEGVDFTFNTQ